MGEERCKGKHDLERFRYSRTFTLHYPKEKGPNGRRLCRWCGEEVPTSRHYWCSQECVQEFYIASGSSGWVIPNVYERDRGVCALCGLDTDQIQRIIERIVQRRYRGRWREHYWTQTEEQSQQRFARDKRLKERNERILRRLYEKYPWAFHRYGTPLSLNPLTRSLWEADHIVPVSEGGGACGLDNYRTLCLPCHKAETKLLKTRLAKNKQKNNS